MNVSQINSFKRFLFEQMFHTIQKADVFANFFFNFMSFHVIILFSNTPKNHIDDVLPVVLFPI